MSSFQQKPHKAYKETAKYGPFKGKINQQKLFVKKNLMADLLNRDFKTIVLKMLRELKDDVKKVKKLRYECNDNINK